MVYNTKGYTPKQGDIIWIEFDPSIGREIKKIKPSVVLSSYKYNATTGFVIVCPITSTHRKEFLELEENQKIKGYINPLQIKGFDFVDPARKVTFAEELQDVELFKVLQVIEDIFELSTSSID
ncbi:type II toxin-antitoxin system PemK/MazF family toxin [Alkalibacterium sp. MB6]|uniref:type II toxin-antitoxin system PemK/MazF family toxin n=1 Tax=Alkalibacterium sp. MB6 TaxID=2081965 RepID=UPI00137B5622|nr:type II toxin-antitoxin system PemK/MazF family toxin [Alkalibacterium sp. MB6]